MPTPITTTTLPGCHCHRGKPAAPLRHYTSTEYEAQIAITRAEREIHLTDLSYGIAQYPETP